jgi:galactokinase
MTRITAFGPGRVNLIGEHTDYNGGLSLPFAIDDGVMVTATAIEGDRIEAIAYDIDDGAQDAFPLAHPPRDGDTGWRAFVRGVVAELTAAGHTLVPARLELAGTLPQGSGLSSSAALEVALALALLGLAGDIEPDRLALARLCSKVENDWVGAQTGLLDQTASLLGSDGNALRIDFATMETQTVPLDLDGWRLATVDSGETHSLATNGYNQRRSECDEAAWRLDVHRISEATAEQVATLPDHLRRRAEHVLSENARVDATVKALRAHDLEEVGCLLNASHASLRDNFEVSTKAVERTVRRCLVGGAVGARMVGGGFGGHVLALFPPEFRLPKGAYEVVPAAGARLIEE